ncbi:hypothetical protein WI80_03150, partial [Burkholderia ubonensis]
LLADAHARVAATLAEHRDALERIARRLLQREAIDHDTLVALIAAPVDAARLARRPEASAPADATADARTVDTQA